ncbi:ABC transporter permease YtrF [Microbacterium lemovicicum]|uniref:ABC transporter permease YtrF n=2 Tax=Microbacterium lemovicicum TaxID=1072463 RepID=A0A3Q9IYA0_9MICO|nr:FtsX-like permease family protein [Microbacterium lemovicicum]AZS35810.1 ABC transporter permease YtrF [Microbacterium lemovicicum]
MTAVAAAPRVAPRSGHSIVGPGAAASAPLGWIRERGMGATVLVSALSAGFGVVLLSTTGYLSALLRADPYVGDSEMLAFILGFLTVLLVGVAVYVAAIVTANTFATVVSGRTRRIALMRLIGASARSQRREVARQGLVVGAVGAFLGLIAGTVLSAVGVGVASSLLGVGDLGYAVVQPVLLVPAVVVTLTTWAAAWAGSRRVLTVTPLQALSGTVEAPHAEVARRTGRTVAAAVLLLAGGALLAGGVVLGLITPLGVIVAFAGGILSFTGLAVGATFLMPPVLRLTGRLFGQSVPARLAAENALRYPERSSRMAIGVVMGVTLVTMFAVAMESVKAVLTATAGGELDAEMATLIDSFSAVMMVLVGFSAVIAAVGLVNLLTIGVVQRRRELGLLRALGLSGGQVRRMVLIEAAHIAISALVAGLVLGTVYGWAGAQSLLGTVPASADSGPVSTLVAPAVPLWPIVAVVVGTAVLTLVAAVVPTRLATRIAPVEAIADVG